MEFSYLQVPKLTLLFQVSTQAILSAWGIFSYIFTFLPFRSHSNITSYRNFFWSPPLNESLYLLGSHSSNPPHASSYHSHVLLWSMYLSVHPTKLWETWGQGWSWHMVGTQEGQEGLLGTQSHRKLLEKRNKQLRSKWWLAWKQGKNLWDTQERDFSESQGLVQGSRLPSNLL